MRPRLRDRYTGAARGIGQQLHPLRGERLRGRKAKPAARGRYQRSSERRSHFHEAGKSGTATVPSSIGSTSTAPLRSSALSFVTNEASCIRFRSCHQVSGW